MIYLLATNIASHVIKGDVPSVRALLTSKPMHEIAVSVITQAELLSGVAKRQHPPSLTARVNEFLVRVSILRWTEDAARVYGDLRARGESSGIRLAPLDMMIAAHALSVDAVLVTADRAFSRLPVGMTLENWTDARSSAPTWPRQTPSR